jgi:hypothetical protein
LKITIQWDALTDLQRVRYHHKRFWIPCATGDVLKTRRTDAGSPPSTTATNLYPSDCDIRRNSIGDIGSDGTRLLAISPASGLISFSNDGYNWLGSDSGQTQPLYGVEFAYGFGTEGLWVLVGANGVVLTSPTGRKWTAQTTGTTSVVRNVRYNTTLGCICPVLGTGQYIQSTDGITWTLNTISGQSSSQYRGVALNGSTFLLCGSNGRASYWNGSAWTHATITGSPNLREAVYEPVSGKWSVYGDSGTIAYTLDPTGAWTVVTATGLTGMIQGASEGAGRILCCTSTGMIYFSTDGGTTWFKMEQTGNQAGAFYGDYGRLLMGV